MNGEHTESTPGLCSNCKGLIGGEAKYCPWCGNKNPNTKPKTEVSLPGFGKLTIDLETCPNRHAILLTMNESRAKENKWKINHCTMCGAKLDSE